jgi:glycosyltransferase involved in cell wall biosynthesis
MRIAVWHDLPSGGGRRALVDQLTGLVARGHEVRVWTTPYAETRGPAVPSGVDERVVPLDIGDPLRWGTHPPAPMIARRIRAMSRHLDLVAEEIQGSRCDVLFGGACQYFRAVDLPARLALPSCLYLGEPFRWLYEALPVPPIVRPAREPGEELRHWARRRARDLATLPGQRQQAAYELASVRSWDRVLVNSVFSRESVRRTYGLDGRVCRLGVDVSRLQRRDLPRAWSLLGLGAVVPEKGIDRVIRAVAALESPRPQLRWVGNVSSDGYSSEMQQLAQDLGIDLVIRTAISDDELAVELSTARALVYAPVLEPFGLAALEASAAGLPVVGVAEGGVRETVVDGVNGLLVDLHELPDAIRKVLQDDQLAARLSAAGPGYVREMWSPERAIDDLEANLLAVQ